MKNFALAILAMICVSAFALPAHAAPACPDGASTIDDVLQKIEAAEGGSTGQIAVKMRSAGGVTVLYAVPENAETAAVFVFEGACLVVMRPDLSPDKIAQVIFGKSRSALFAPEKGA